MSKGGAAADDDKVFALDCEMCYTTDGPELTRVTVIDTDLKTVYETLVKPDNPILDYNTRFSGITEEDLSGVHTTIRDVQAVLLSKFSDKTILIGHSFDSDLKALRVQRHIFCKNLVSCFHLIVFICYCSSFTIRLLIPRSFSRTREDRLTKKPFVLCAATSCKRLFKMTVYIYCLLIICLIE